MKNSKLLLSIIALLVLGLGWYLLTEDAAQNNQQSTSTIYSDSIPAPERPTFTAQDDTSEKDTAEEKKTPSVGEELAPGTALVKAVIASADLDSKTNRELIVKTEEVLGYGSSTPPIAGKEELTITVERFLKNNPDRKVLMQKGDTITMVISSERGMNFGDSQDKKSWTLVDLKSK